MMTEGQARAELANARAKLTAEKEKLEQAQSTVQIATINVQQLQGIVAALSIVVGVPAEAPKEAGLVWFSTLTDVSRAARRRAGKGALRAA